MTRAAIPTSPHGAAKLAENIWTAYNARERTLLTLGSVVAYLLFAGVGRTFGIPAIPDYAASLMNHPSPLLATLLVAVALAAAVLVCTMLAGRVRFEAGLFCAALGMMALSIRGGAMRYVLMYASGPGVYLRLAFETALLFGVVAIGWYVLLILRDMNLLANAEPLRDDDPDANFGTGLMAMGAQVIAMIFLLMLLAQSDKKAQAIWSVGIASLLATLLAHSLFPARPSIWFWAGPFVVAMIGYTVAWFGGAPGAGGEVGGLLPQLARPLPLDYATVGVAGAIMGYWTSRSWQQERDHDPDNPDQVEEALEHDGRK